MSAPVPQILSQPNSRDPHPPDNTITAWQPGAVVSTSPQPQRTQQFMQYFRHSIHQKGWLSMLFPPRRNPFRWSAGKLFAHTALWTSLWVGFSVFITVANVP